MNKEIYLIRGSESEDYVRFKNKISAVVSRLIAEAAPEALKYTITEKAPPGFSIIPFSKKKIAAISVYNAKPHTTDFIKEVIGFYGAYRVTEALPVTYTVTWQSGEPTPGACLFTLLCKKKDIDQATFIHRWFDVHSPHSVHIHPLWNYVRNVVDEMLSTDSIWFDGIVEEQVREEQDLLNPFRFWGNPLVILPRMIKELYDTRSFIDYPSMETYIATEYLVKTKP